jgi:hypothetical protein
MAAPVERKVQASATVAAVSGMVLWVLGRYLFKGDVPDVIASWVYVAVPGVMAFAAGYLAKHTDRPPALAVTVTGSMPPEAAASFRKELGRVTGSDADTGTESAT